MKKSNGYLALRAILALFAIFTCILWAAAQYRYSGGGGTPVSGPEDLREELRRAQLLAPPSDSWLSYDAGTFTCVPGPGRIESEFAAGLVARLLPDGSAVWPVTVYEDERSMDTVFLNADGDEVCRLGPEEGIDPAWATRLLFPCWSLTRADERRHAGSRVVLSARLAEPGAGASRIWSGAAKAGAPWNGPSSAPPGYKDYLVVWNGPSNVWVAGDAGAAPCVAEVDAGWSHGVALHDDGSLTRVGIDPDTRETVETRFESAAAALASAGALGDTFVLGFDGALKRVSGFGELEGEWPDAGRVVQIASGTGFLLALRNNGTVLALGDDGSPVPPDGLSGVAEVAAGAAFGAALMHNGSLVAWGDPRVATNIASGVRAVSASRRGAHCLALLKDGRVAAWGDGSDGQCRVPEGLSDVAAVAAGGHHSVALKSDGTVVCWGLVGGAPPYLTNAVSVGASYLDAWAVTDDGKVAVWGDGCPYGDVVLSAARPGVCGIVAARVVDCGLYMAVVRVPGGLLEGDADGDGATGVEEVFLYGTDPASAEAPAVPADGQGEAHADKAGGKGRGGAGGASGGIVLASYTFGGPGSTTYYADASMPDDGGDGTSWETAKKTIQAAVDLAQAGDTVLVTDGVYNAGCRLTPGGSYSNRLVVTNGALVKSVNGAAVTTVTGSGSAWYNTSRACRCVFLTDGVLDGFTLDGGAAVSHWTSSSERDKSGGCLNMWYATPDSDVRNCILKNGKAYDGGGAWGGRFVNCLFCGSYANYGGGAYWSALLSCTVATNSASSSCGGARNCGVTNSVVYGNTSWESPNCHACTVSYSCSDPDNYGLGNTGDNVLFADPLFAAAVSGDFTLLYGSPCVDAGTNAYAEAETDISGDPRIQGPAVDMGAFEFPTDTDGDGVPDWLDPDDDNDGLTDDWEAAHASWGYDPLDASDGAWDADGDGMPNTWEYTHGLDPLSGLADSLAGWWQFREGAGTNSADLSGHGNGAFIVLTNHVAWAPDAPAGAALRYDTGTNGVSLGSSGGYVCVPGLSGAPLSNGFTVAAWVRADSYPDYATVLTMTTDHDQWYDGMSLYHEGSLAFYAGEYGTGHLIQSGAEGTGVWIHVCGVYDGTNACIYINGALCGVRQNVPPGTNTTDALWIGTVFGQVLRPWDGDIADARFYTSALTTDQIAGLLEFLADPDDDGLTNIQEYDLETDPSDPDTDGDGVSDGPLAPPGHGLMPGTRDAFPVDGAAWRDTDGDGMPDELLGVSCTGLVEDTDDDGDGLEDVEEIYGRVIEWGKVPVGVNVIDRPAHLGAVVAAAANKRHRIALRADGSVVCWGLNLYGRCVPPPEATGAVAVALGDYHSMAVRADGSVVCWGSDGSGQCSGSVGVTGVIAVAGGMYHSVALKDDWTVVCWGNDSYGQCSGSAGLTGVVAVAAGQRHSVALLGNGTVVCWGDNAFGQLQVPSTLTNAVAVSAGANHTVALTADNKIVCWGSDASGQCSVPGGLPDVIRAGSGYDHTLACTADGLIKSWGSDSQGQIRTFLPYAPVLALGGGDNYSLALLAGVTDPKNPDSDGDGIRDGDEIALGTDPAAENTDGDGLPDGWERDNGFDPLSGLADSLAGWWQFREGSGTNSADLSGNGNTAYVCEPGHVAWVTNALVGGALRFDTSTNGVVSGYNGGYVCVPGLAGVSLSNGFTAAAWVRANSYPDYAPILTMTTDHDGRYDGMSLYHDSNLSFYANSRDAGHTIESGVSITGEWTHVCCVYNGTNEHLYVNGTLCGSLAGVTPGTNTADGLWIGTVFGQVLWPWDGDIADVRFYTSALTTNQVAGLIEFASDADGDGVTNLQEFRRGTDPRDPESAIRTLYADSDVGSPQYDGYSPSAESETRGPKATVQQAVDASVSGDTVELSGQAAFADAALVPGGKSVILRPVGHVRF